MFANRAVEHPPDGGRLGCSIARFCELPFSATAVAGFNDLVGTEVSAESTRSVGGMSGRGRSLAIGADERRELERDAGSGPTPVPSRCPYEAPSTHVSVPPTLPVSQPAASLAQPTVRAPNTLPANTPPPPCAPC
ncbi:hypothetical protein THAOC_11099, partial [Thalassiosira oceanica]